MSGKAMRRDIGAASRLNLAFSAMGVAVAFICTTSTGQAAIIGTGNVSPSNPASWTSSTIVYIGNTSTGSVTVDSGSDLLSSYATLGYNSGSTGTATVTGAGSTWTNKGYLRVGYNGSGTLDIKAGGQVGSYDGVLGYSTGTGTATVSGAGSKWFSSGVLYVGDSGSGTLNVQAGGQVSNYSGYLGYGSRSSGAATVTGAGSTWTNSVDLHIGYSGSGTLTVTDGGTVVVNRALYASLTSLYGNGVITANGAVLDADILFDATHGLQQSFAFGTGGTLNLNQAATAALGAGNKGTGTLRIADGMTVVSSSGYLGFASGSNGTATVTGNGSKWTNSGELNVGYNGSGTLNVQAGGQVSSYDGVLGEYPDSTGTVTVTGAGSTWTNGLLFLGDRGRGTMNVQAGAYVSTGWAYLGFSSGGTGTATVTGSGSMWTTNAGDLYVGDDGSGTLTVNDGGTVLVGGTLYTSLASLYGNGVIAANGVLLDADIVFDATHGLQQSIAFGTGGILNLNQTATKVLGAGYKGHGTVRIADGVAVTSSAGYIGYGAGSDGAATVTGNGSRWTTSGTLYVGGEGGGTLVIEDGAQVSDASGSVGSTSGYPSTATVTGAGSKWLNGSYLDVSNGNLNITAGGYVTSTTAAMGNSEGTTGAGTVTVAGTGSTWFNAGSLNIYTGTLSIEAGGYITDITAYVGSRVGSTGTGKVAGAGALWSIQQNLYVGYTGVGTLNIGCDGSGGQVVTTSVTLGTYTGSTGTVTIDGGGILQAASISKGSGNANFNWKDGTIQNYDVNTNLSIGSNLLLKLAATGTHAFNVDQNRTGTISAILSDATSGGTLAKQGQGLLTLTGANTYSGKTTIEAGRFKVTGSILNISGVDVSAGATLELAKTSGSATAGSLPISNAGTILISAGSQTVGEISGTGITQVSPGAILTAKSIMQDSLFIGTSGAGVSGEIMSQVPEPGMIVLLLLGVAVAVLGFRLQSRRCCGNSCS